MLEFNNGDIVVVPGCGLGLVEEIEVLDMEGATSEMYKILVEATEVRMWVPVVMARAQGLRAPMKASAIESILDTIRTTVPPKKRANWNRRKRRYNEQLLSNDPIEMARLLGELASVKSTKTLSFGERTLFDKVRDLLEAELKLAGDCDSVEGLFEAALAA